MKYHAYVLPMAAVVACILFKSGDAAAEKLVFAHYMPGYSQNINYTKIFETARDEIRSGNLKPTETDAPLEAASFYGGVAPWGKSQGDFIRHEISTAMAAGINGFIFDYGGGVAPHVKNMNAMQMQLGNIKAFFSVAEKYFPGFKLSVALDESGLGSDPLRRLNTIVQFMKAEGASASLFREKGRPVFFSYHAWTMSPFVNIKSSACHKVSEEFVSNQARVINQWKKILKQIKPNPLLVADLPNAWMWKMWGCGDATRDEIISMWAKAFYGISMFGVTDTLSGAGGLYPEVSRIAHEYGSIYVSPVWWGYYPLGGRMLMPGAKDALGTWQLAKSANADWVVLNTWNDFTEESDWAPSVRHGCGLFDIATALSSWFKSGSYLLPRTPIVVLFYRGFTATVKSSKFPGGYLWDPLDDEVTAVVITRRPGEISVNQGKAVKVPAGVTSVSWPLLVGPMSATFVYGGKHQQVTARGMVDIKKEPGDELWSTYVAASAAGAEDPEYGACRLTEQTSVHGKGSKEPLGISRYVGP